MKKIKLPLEMANGVMVRSLDELRENWDLEKIVSHYGDGSLVTWLNDRYYTDLAEQVQKITATGVEAQKQLCAVFGVEFKQDEVVDVEAVAERKRKLDILRQYTSDDEVLKNIDHVAFNQEDLADLLRKDVEKIYLFANKFTIPLVVEGKKYIGVGDNVIAEICSEKSVNFSKRRIEFSNVRFDGKYAAIHEDVSKKPKISVKVGDIVKLGEWHNAPIEWQVLDVKEGKALLLSKYALACRKYHDTIANITWENCDLRKWLNGEFFKKAFKGDEAKCVVESHVEAHDNPDYKINPGNDTEDKIFLLSVKEVLQYFKTSEERICMSLSFVKDEGAYVDDNGACYWWLRSAGFGANLAASVSIGGAVISYGDYVSSVNDAIRPALWYSPDGED